MPNSTSSKDVNKQSKKKDISHKSNMNPISHYQSKLIDKIGKLKKDQRPKKKMPQEYKIADITTNQLEYFTLKSDTEFHLSELNYKDIVIRKIQSPDNNIYHLLSNIQITARYPDHRENIEPFRPGSYINAPQAKMAITDDFRKVIRNCKVIAMKILTIGIISPEKFELMVFYEKAKFKIEKVIGTAVEQYDGITYNLLPQSLIEIKTKFPNSAPVRSVFVANGAELGIKFKGPVYYSFLSTLTGLAVDQIDYIKEIEFSDPKTNGVRFSLYYGRSE